MQMLETTEETRFLITDAGMDALHRAVVVPDTDEDGEGEAEETFTPDTADKVNWVLDKIATHRARAARIQENAELMAREADRQASYLEWRFGAALQDFVRRETEGTRKRSIRLEHGVLGFRTKPACVNVSDEAVALEWAKTNLPTAVTERLDRKVLTDMLLATGEVVEFAPITPAEEQFYIK